MEMHTRRRYTAACLDALLLASSESWPSSYADLQAMPERTFQYVLALRPVVLAERKFRAQQGG